MIVGTISIDILFLLGKFIVWKETEVGNVQVKFLLKIVF